MRYNMNIDMDKVNSPNSCLILNLENHHSRSISKVNPIAQSHLLSQVPNEGLESDRRARIVIDQGLLADRTGI